MKIQWVCALTLSLVAGMIAHTDVATAQDVCVSTNGFVRQQHGASFCATTIQGDRATAINHSNAYALGREDVGAAQAMAREFSSANAQLNSTAEAADHSSASAYLNSDANADDSSLAEASVGSRAEAMNDGSAIAMINSTAIAMDGGCAYASGNSTAVAGAGEIVVVIDGSLINVDETNVGRYCRVWPPGGTWPLP